MFLDDFQVAPVRPIKVDTITSAIWCCQLLSYNYCILLVLFTLVHTVFTLNETTAADCEDPSSGLLHQLGSSWTDSNTGCSCVCKTSDIGNIVVCEHCDKTVTQHESLQRCIYEPTGQNYTEGMQWMSVEEVCSQCQCNAGAQVTCVSTLHCAPVCQVGQIARNRPCCETDCVGEARNSISYRSCYSNVTAQSYKHGETPVFTQHCVDRKCQCVDGEWRCFHFCSPMASLPCPAQERFLWDPFCCVRCRGKQNCHTDNSTVIPAGGYAIIDNQKCSCLNGTFHCPLGPVKPVASGCYYPPAKRFYSLKSRWRAPEQPCTECHCHDNGTYSCSPQTCDTTGCAPGETPPPGDCCSRCSHRDVTPATNLTCLWNATGVVYPDKTSRLFPGVGCQQLVCECREGHWECGVYCPHCTPEEVHQLALADSGMHNCCNSCQQNTSDDFRRDGMESEHPSPTTLIDASVAIGLVCSLIFVALLVAVAVLFYHRANYPHICRARRQGSGRSGHVPLVDGVWRSDGERDDFHPCMNKCESGDSNVLPNTTIVPLQNEYSFDQIQS